MPKITPYNMDLFLTPVVDLYQALENELFVKMAKRLKNTKNYSSDNVLQWQIDKMADLRLINRETIEELAKVSGVAESKITELINKAGYDTILSVDDEMGKLGMDKLSAPTQIDQIMKSYVNQTMGDLTNNINQTLITTNNGLGSTIRAYTNILNEVTAKTITGFTTIEQAIEESVLKMAEKGLDSGFRDKAGRYWSTQRYADTVLKSTVNRTYNDLRIERMSDYDVTTVVVSSIDSARPACALCQGQVLDTRPSAQNDSKYKSVYDFGYGTPGGHRGVNCRHQWFTFIDGVSTNNQPQVNPEDANKRADIVAGQRALERRIRKTKQKIALTDALDSDSKAKYEELLVKQKQSMKDYIKKNELGRRLDREKYIDVN